MKTCPQCGESTPASAGTCAYCGATLPQDGIRAPSKRPSTVAIVLMVVLALAGGLLGYSWFQAHQREQSRLRSKLHLKWMGLGVHEYHATFDYLPLGGSFDEHFQQERHGWMTSLLPYVDQAPLYNRINFAVPYTDPVNAPAMGEALEIYTIPGNLPVRDGRGFGLAHYSGNSHLFRRNAATGLRDVEDGAPSTILLGEVAGGYVPWASCENFRDPGAGFGDSAAQYGSTAGNGVQFLMLDGSVRVFGQDVTRDLLRALATPSGNDSVGTLE